MQLPSAYRLHEHQKQRSYDQRVWEVEHACLLHSTSFFPHQEVCHYGTTIACMDKMLP